MRGTCRAKARSTSLSKKVRSAASKATETWVGSEQFSKTCLQRHSKSEERVKNDVESTEVAFSKSEVYPFVEEQPLQLSPSAYNFLLISGVTVEISCSSY